ncbi:Uncharacterised protein [Citrobacter koseri]|nr:Uncharacterised protein [Citrobacter koseri]
MLVSAIVLMIATIESLRNPIFRLARRELTSDWYSLTPGSSPWYEVNGSSSICANVLASLILG